MTVKHRYKPATMHEILQNPNGGLAKDMLKRAVKVQAEAKKNLQRPPKRVNTGALRASITITPFLADGYPAMRIGSGLEYAKWVHDGTGIYGPNHQMIEPKTAKALHWEGPGGVNVFAKKSRGMPGNPFLKDALKAAKL